MGFFSWLFRRKPKKIKLGLALGSGGAKGFAELGVLKAFEENGVQFDVVAGTSIGSIIGAAYANGYTSTDIYELLKKVNPSDIANLMMIKMDTSGLFKVVDDAIGNKNIEELKKPFAAVATRTDTGDAQVFKSGKAALAICASSSMPPFFKPVTIDGKTYVDGAFSNSVPADVVKEMGADYIVGVGLSVRESKTGVLSKIMPTFRAKTDAPWENGYAFGNVIIHPDLRGYKAVSFRQDAQMYEIGYRAATDVMPSVLSEIAALRKGKKIKKRN